MIYYRDDTIEDEDEEEIINPNKQLFISTLARRGKGKSYADESFFIKLVKMGYTGLDLWASDNLENGFWCVECDCQKKRKIRIEKLENKCLAEKDPKKRAKLDKRLRKETRKLHCKAHKRFPVTILGPESLEINQNELKTYNNEIYKEEEWYQKYPYEKYHKLWDFVHPQEKPQYERGPEWAKFIKLPFPTKQDDTEVNQKIVEMFTKAVLDCRKRKRILVFNPMLFPNEFQCFKTLEIIIRSLKDVRQEHFNRLDPEDVNKESWDEMTNHEKNFDKMLVLFREFGELAPSKLKGDKLGFSTLVKKALLQLMRKVRHYQISVITDWQKNDDVESAIRGQVDITFIKKWTKRLAGEEFKWAFDFVKEKRLAILEKGKYKQKAYRKANSLYPRIEKLAPQYMYHAKDDDTLELLEVPILETHHKEPWESWSKFTGIKLRHNKEMVKKVIQESTRKSATQAEKKTLLTEIMEMRNGKYGGHKMFAKEMIPKLGNLQEAGELTWNKPLANYSVPAFNKAVERLTAEFPHLITVKVPKKRPKS